MTAVHVIEFSVSDTLSNLDDKCEAIVDSIIEQFVPAVGLTTGTCPEELSARLLIELAFHLGSTHSSISIMSMLGAVADAAREGHETATKFQNRSDLKVQALIDIDCPPVKH